MVIFHGYVSLPEGNHHDMKKNRPPWLKQAKCRSFSWGNHGFSWFFPHLQAIDYFRGDAEYHMYSQLVGFIKSRISYHNIVCIYIYTYHVFVKHTVYTYVYIYIQCIDYIICIILKAHYPITRLFHASTCIYAMYMPLASHRSHPCRVFPGFPGAMSCAKGAANGPIFSMAASTDKRTAQVVQLVSLQSRCCD